MSGGCRVRANVTVVSTDFSAAEARSGISGVDAKAPPFHVRHTWAADTPPRRRGHVTPAIGCRHTTLNDTEA